MVESIGIILVNYKTTEETIVFVTKELSKVKVPWILVIVNNDYIYSDTDKFKLALGARLVTNIEKNDFEEGRIFIINSTLNLGFAKGNNLGAEFLLKNFKVKYLLFTNNDIIIQSEDVVEKLIEKIETLPSVALIGPKIADQSGKLISPRFDRISSFRFIIHHLLYPFYSTNFFTKIGLQTKGRSEIEDRKITEGFCYWIAGAFMLMKAEDFFAIKGFDPNTFLYCEEKILSERLASINKQVYYLSYPLIISIGGMTTSKYLSNRKRDMILYDSELYYYKKYMHITELTYWVMQLTRYIYFNIYYKD